MALERPSLYETSLAYIASTDSYTNILKGKKRYTCLGTTASRDSRTVL